MTDQTEFSVAKETGTYADTLKAVGLASILQQLATTGTQVTVSDAGANFLIRLSSPLPNEHRAELTVGYQYLAHEKAGPAPRGIRPDPFPYRQQKEVENVWWRWRNKQGRVSKRKGGTGGDIFSTEPQSPDPRFKLFKALNVMFSGSKSWNDLAGAIQRQISEDSDALAAYALSRALQWRPLKPEPLGAAEAEAKAKVLQAFWPTAGKGINRTKPDGAKLDNLKDPWVDWFDEWCRYRGVGYLLSARFVGSGSQDIKVLCLAPGTQISLPVLQKLADELTEERMFVAGHAYSNVKSDVFAVLGLAEWLVTHSEYVPNPEERTVRFLRTIRPSQPHLRDVLAGVQVAYFKKLGTGKALSNVSTILLPDWLPVSTATYETWRTVLDEHQRVLASLDEEEAEEAGLLLAYRDAVSRNELDLYLDFFADYGANYMRKKARGQYGEQFTQPNLEVLTMALSDDLNPRIADLVKTPGFRGIANAVHEATVKAQYWKGQGQQEYEIHYGLAQRWKRATDQGTEFFLQELADFVRSYNEENAKRQEKKKPTRDAVAQADLDTLLAFVTSGDVNAKMVCLLLLAYGFSMTADEKARAEAAREAKRAERTAS
ncbi:MAG: hypothetical protein HY270_23140 [Deltaproteobacteria bacterium]|nr:hypothetical protein [Deltaproteobacteria bacterium]